MVTHSTTAKLTALIVFDQHITANQSNKIEFVVDSGATSHMINQRDILINEKLCKNPTDAGITIAKKDVFLSKESMGQLILENDYGERFIMSDVILAPDLVTNLLSVKMLC